jgi:hypothetical protein
MINKNKFLIGAYVVFFILLIITTFIWISGKNESFNIEKNIQSTSIEGTVIITNATGDERTSIVNNIMKDRFDTMTDERKEEYVEKMYFSTCGQIEDFCASANYTHLQGCEYCEGK